MQNFRANSYIMAGMTGVLHLSNYLDFRLNTYGFVPLWKIDQGTQQQAIFRKDQFDISLAASAALVFHSAIGPIGVRANYQRDPETPYSVIAHVGFLLLINALWSKEG